MTLAGTSQSPNPSLGSWGGHRRENFSGSSEHSSEKTEVGWGAAGALLWLSSVTLSQQVQREAGEAQGESQAHLQHD